MNCMLFLDIFSTHFYANLFFHIKNQQLGEWSIAGAVVWVSRVRLLSMS